MIAHLKGREKALEAFGLEGTQGRVDRAGVPPQRRVHPRAGDAVPGHAPRTGAAARPRADRPGPGRRGDRARHPGDRARVPDLRAGPLPRARSGAHPPPPHGVPEVLLRRLLSLDYVIEHSDLPWLPTEEEKVAAFEALGIERDLLPVKVYRGAAGTTRRHFPVKLPVALDSARALFVYAEPGHDTATALRSWGKAHAGLWRALRSRGLSSEIVAVARTSRELERARRVTRGWAEPTGHGKPDPGIRRGTRPDRAGDPPGRGPHPRGVRRPPGRAEAQHRARKPSAPAGAARIDRPRHRLADGAAPGGAIPMSVPATYGRT